MISKFRQAFDILNVHDITYCVFKSFDHLQHDIQHAESDIDILITTSQLVRLDALLSPIGFKRVLRPTMQHRYFYIAYDERSKKRVSLDFEVIVKLGTKPVRPYRWDIAEKILQARVWDSELKLHKTASNDLAWLELLLLSTDVNRVCDVSSSKKDYVKDLFSTNNKAELQSSVLAQDVLDILKMSFDQVMDSFQQDQILWSDFHQRAMRYLNDSILKKSNTLFRICIFQNRRIIYFLSRKLSGPNLRVRKRGKKFAILGVDGAGKSTQIDKILKNRFLIDTGVKRIYFGHNEFWLPGLNQLIGFKVNNKLNNSVIRALISGLKIIDRRAKLLQMAYYCFRGNHVICDRYFYDDIVMMKTERFKNRHSLIQLVSRLLHGWLGITPNKTFYLDIDADAAYQRKQDYAFELLEENIVNYRAYFETRREAIIISALQPIEDITRQITATIFEC